MTLNASFCPSKLSLATRFAPGPPHRRSRPAIAVRVRAEEGAEPGSNPILNAQFMGVLQQSLARQGADALTRGPEVTEAERQSATEEVLAAALVQSKQTLKLLQLWKNQVDGAIVAQEKQVDRMEFALNKARNDAAYMKALKHLAYDSGPDV